MSSHYRLRALPALSCFFLLVALAPASLGVTQIQHVIAISVDGARGDFLLTFIDTAPTEFPNLKRLRTISAYTFNARCDYTESITIPDHLCMLTGRPVRQPTGLPASLQHGITSDAPLATETAHNSGLNPAVYKASIFDVVHDRGMSTALYMGKTRLTICDRSWDATNGALDTNGADNGRDKIDVSSIVEANGNAAATPGMLASLVSSIQAGTLKNFTFFHIADTDYAGHSGGWRTTAGSTYRNVMRVADGWLGQILDAVQGNSALVNKVAIILTADHGGGGAITPDNTHTDATRQGNYTIPFILFAPGVTPDSNIYSLFENRYDPASGRPTYADARQPMRNGDVANISAALLGLPPVPGSSMTPEFVKPLQLVRNANDVTVTWPAYLTAWTLEFTDELPGAPWQTVTSSLSDSNGQHVHTVPAPLPPKRFYRLRHQDVSPAAAWKPQFPRTRHKAARGRSR